MKDIEEIIELLDSNMWGIYCNSCNVESNQECLPWCEYNGTVDMD